MPIDTNVPKRRLRWLLGQSAARSDISLFGIDGVIIETVWRSVRMKAFLAGSVPGGLQMLSRLFSLVQAFRYMTIAGAGPVIAAALHGWCGGWTWPLVFLLVLVLASGLASLRGRRDYAFVDHGE